MAARAPADPLASWWAACTHPRRAELEQLLAVLLESGPGLRAGIKWGGPSVSDGVADRLTFRLQPGDRVELVFHRGVKPPPAPGFRFPDPSGRLRFAAPDRAVWVFADAADTAACLAALRETAAAWLIAAQAADAGPLPSA